ncbi:MAG: hypothetical protein ACE5I3_16095 [Phycisphaerae bacterium]
MGENRSPLLADLPHRIRAQTAELKANLRQWWADLRQDPSLLWRTTAIRISFWLTLGICALVAVRALSRSLLPHGEADAEQVTPLAILYVACTNTACYGSYTTRQPMDFDAWPLTCRECSQQTVHRAKLCAKCRNWYATAPGDLAGCPFCAAAEPEQPAETPQTRPVDRDDAEDPW